MKQQVKLGQVDYSVFVFIPDPASTDGSGKTGLVAANLTVSGLRMETDNDVTVIDYTSSLNDLANITATHNDWGLKEVSSTLCPGVYRLDIADAIFAAGAWSAVVYVMITSSAAAASPMEFMLIPQAPIDGVLLAPTTHTSAVIPTVTTLTGHTPQTGDVYALANGSSGFVAIAGYIDTEVGAIKTDTAAIKVKTDFLPSATAGAAGGVFIAGTNAATAVSITGNITGNLSGSVGSVTGNIGGNVIGSVGSVTGSTAQSGDVYALANGAAGFVATKADTAAIKAKTDNLPSDPADASDIATATGTIITNLGTVAGYIDTEVAAIKTKTDFLPSATAGAAGGVFIAGSNAATTANITGNITGNLSGSVGSVTGNVGGNVVGSVGSVTGSTAQTGDSFARLGAPVGASHSADVASVKADTAAILIDTGTTLDGRIPAALVGGRMDANTGAINASATAASRLERSARAIGLGTVGTGSSTTSIVTSSLNPAASIADQFKDRIIIFDEATTTAVLRGQKTDVSASSSGGVLTVVALTTAPVSGDTFTIL